MEGAAGKGQSETGLTNGGGIVTDAPAVLQHIDKLEVIKLFMNRIEEMKHFTVIILCDKFIFFNHTNTFCYFHRSKMLRPSCFVQK